MATRTIVLRTDDITGEESENVDARTVKLPFLDEDGDTGYVKVSFDATDETYRGFIEALYKGIQTKYLNKSGVVVKQMETGSSDPNTEASDMRDFARSKGLKVSDRGRVSREVQDAYRAAVANGEWTPPTPDDATEATESAE